MISLTEEEIKTLRDKMLEPPSRVETVLTFDGEDTKLSKRLTEVHSSVPWGAIKYILETDAAQKAGVGGDERQIDMFLDSMNNSVMQGK